MSEPTEELPPHANEVLSHISDALTEIAIALNAMAKSIIEILAMAKQQEPPKP